MKNAQKKGVPFLVQNREKHGFFAKNRKNRVFFGANVGNYLEKNMCFSHVLKFVRHFILFWEN